MSYAPEIVVAIIDDHEAIRVGMSAALRASGRFVGVREGAATVGEFLACGSSRPSPTLPMSCCWILNLGDESDPKENAEALRAEGYRVLVYSIADNVRLLRRALAGGADGVCRSADPIADTVEAIVAVAHGRQVISQEILAAIEGDAGYVAAALGPREREVLSLYAAGLEIPQIGRTLYITENSVKEYLKRIRAKYTQVDRPAVQAGTVPASGRGRHRPPGRAARLIRQEFTGAAGSPIVVGSDRTPRRTTAPASRGTPHDEPAQRSDPGQSTIATIHSQRGISRTRSPSAWIASIRA